MSKPIIFFDLEATGVDVAKDRIVSIAFQKFNRLGGALLSEFYQIVNPGVLMSDEVVAIHGITNEEAAKYPPFSQFAGEIFAAFHNCDLAGFNHTNFDIPMLWEEFNRCGLEWNLGGVNFIDVGNIFKKKEERTLSAAVRFYCGKEHVGAHSALADVRATAEVLNAQLARYPDLAAIEFMHDNPMDELARFCRFEDRLDLAGKIIRDKDGDPAYSFGQKTKGVKVRDDIGFAHWMLGKDFSTQTKMVLREIIRKIEQEAA
jgi:DNA polymerase III subunit epsilon